MATPESNLSSTDASASADWPTCTCGTDRTMRAATPEREYSFLGTMYALWGGTAIPIRVNFRCVHCGVVFDGDSERETRLAFVI
jgi:hypothetical protein